MKKQLIAFLALASVLSTSVVGLAGCGEKYVDDETTLQIFVSDFGYGTEWLNDLVEEFKNTDWVMEKYPELKVAKPASNSDRTFPAERMITDGTTNEFDLLFSCDSANAYYDRTDASGVGYFEDLTSVYEAEIPGEDGVTVAEKMNDKILANMLHTGKDGKQAYYAMPWVNGYMGLLYNQTLVNQHLGADYVLPRTTNELGEMATALYAKKVTPFISSTKSGYWNQVSFTWWVQYEGLDRYEDYWQGVNERDRIDNKNFAQLGRLRSLEALEELIGVKKGADGKDYSYNHPDVNELEFTAAQSKYILGEAVMMPNGDWFENEMRANYEEDTNHYDIRFMQMPVISSIVETMDLYTHGETAYTELSADEKAAYDDLLAAIVAVVDANGTLEDAQKAVADLTQADFDKVSTARKIVYGVENHEAYIPTYAKAKGIAKDFLIFMASNAACQSFMASTNGASTAFEYDVKTEAPELYDSFSTLQKERAKIAQNGIAPFSATTSRLCYLGGLTYYGYTNNLEKQFTSQNATDRRSPSFIYQYDIEYYTKNDNQYWKEMLNRAGIASE